MRSFENGLFFLKFWLFWSFLQEKSFTRNSNHSFWIQIFHTKFHNNIHTQRLVHDLLQSPHTRGVYKCIPSLNHPQKIRINHTEFKSFRPNSNHSLGIQIFQTNFHNTHTRFHNTHTKFKFSHRILILSNDRVWLWILNVSQESLCRDQTPPQTSQEHFTSIWQLFPFVLILI